MAHGGYGHARASRPRQLVARTSCPRRRSTGLEARLEEGRAPAFMYGEPKGTVVCRGGTVCWLGESTQDWGRTRRVVFALDVLTERTWMTELPEKYVVLERSRSWKSQFSLATSEDGRLSLIVSLSGHQVEVWGELAAGDGRRWTLRRTIDVRRVLPSLRRYTHIIMPKKGKQVRITLFCPRSRCLFGTAHEGHRLLLIPVDRDSPRLISEDNHSRVSCYPCEMDWSTYVSRMKYF